MKASKKPRGRPPGSKNKSLPVTVSSVPDKLLKKATKQFKLATEQSIKYTALNVPKYELTLLCYTDAQLITVTNLLRDNSIIGLRIKFL